MSSQSELNEAIERVRELLEQLDSQDVEVHELPELETPPDEESMQDEGHEDGDSNDQPTGNEAEEANQEVPYRPHQYIIAVEARVGPSFFVRAVDGDRYFDVLSEFNLAREVAEYYAEDDFEQVEIDSLPDDHPIFVNWSLEELQRLDDEKVSRLATSLEALDNVGNDIKGEIIYQLTDIFTRASVKHTIQSTRPGGKGGVKGFQVYYRIFPYEDDFGMSHLNEVIERVRMAAQRGKVFLKYSFQLDIDFGGTTGGSQVGADIYEDNPSSNWTLDGC